VPAEPYGECFSVTFNVTADEAAILDYLLVRSTGASSQTSGKVYLDGVFLGHLLKATLGGRCDFNQDCFEISLQQGQHSITICTSVYDYKTGPELDDIAFWDLRLVENHVPTQEKSWGEIKKIYSR